MNPFLRYLIGVFIALVLILLGGATSWLVISFLTWTWLPFDISAGLMRFYLLIALILGYWLRPGDSKRL